MNRTQLSLSTLALFAAAPLMAQGDVDVQPFAKQLAGPPAEIAAMRAPSPTESTIHSRSALLPVRFAADGTGGQSWQGALPVENGVLRFLVFAPAQAQWQVDLVGASGRSVEAGALATRVVDTDFALGEARVPTVRYDFDNLQGDQWNLKLSSPAGAGDGFVLIEGDAGTELASYPTHARQLVGERLGVAAVLTTSNDHDVLVGRKAGRITHAILRVTAPDGRVSEHPMFDDGRHDDGRAGDGLFAGDFPADVAGNYTAQVDVRGSNARGAAFVRTAEHLLPVVEESLSIGAARASAVAGDANRLSIRVPVTARKAG